MTPEQLEALAVEFASWLKETPTDDEKTFASKHVGSCRHDDCYDLAMGWYAGRITAPPLQVETGAPTHEALARIRQWADDRASVGDAATTAEHFQVSRDVILDVRKILTSAAPVAPVLDDVLLTKMARAAHRRLCGNVDPDYCIESGACGTYVGIIEGLEEIARGGGA